MALKHDAQGFLVGDTIDLSKAVADWAAIRDDVRAIRQAVFGIESALKRASPEARASVSATPVRGAGMDEADPTVKAFNEVAQPMAPDARQADRAARSPQNPQAEAAARQGLTGQPAQAPRRERQIPVLLRAPAVPQTGGAGGNAARRDPENAALVTRAVDELRAARPATQRAPVQPLGRDSGGRFARNPAAARTEAGRVAGAGLADNGRDGQDESALRSLADRIVGVVKESGAGMDEADPTVKAFNEVAQPMARGYELLTGGDKDKRQEGWLRRIYTSLTGFREDETVFNKAANKSLKVLEEKPPEVKSGGDRGGLLGMMSGLLSKIPVIGPMLAGGTGMMGGAGEGLMGVGKGLLGAGKGMLRRVPLLGALIGGLGAASNIYDSETDDSLSRREKDQRVGRAGGGLAGSLGGMLAGAKLGAMAGAFAGPVGAAIGGAIGGAAGMFFGDQAGQIIGEKVGGWVSDLREADIPGKVVGSWDATTDFLKKGWDGALEKLSDAWKGIKDAGGQAAQWASEKANSANAFIKDKTGVDVKGAAVAAKEKAVEVGTKAVEGAKAGVEYLGNNTTVGKGIKATGEAVKYGADVAVDVAKSAKARITGKAAENKDALINQMAASGITDPKEQAMFMAQMDHESGGFTKMEERFNYRSADRLMAVSGSARKLGKPAVEEAMAQGPEAVAEAMYGGRMGNVNPGDAYAFRGRGHVQITGRDNYTAAGKALGLDLANNPDLAAEPEHAAKIAAWYWKKNKLSDAAQQGDVLSVTKKINGGANGLDDREKKYAKYLASANDGSLTQTSEGAQGKGPSAPQQQPVVAQSPAPVGAAGIVSPAAPVVASASAPPVSVAPSVPAVAEAPPITVPMASGDSGKPIVVAAQSRDVGQDLRERGIAHIATGGLGGA